MNIPINKLEFYEYYLMGIRYTDTQIYIQRLIKMLRSHKSTDGPPIQVLID